MEPTNRIPEISENPDGLHRRYIISKADGSPIDEGAQYFVLRLDDNGKDRRHVEACRAAILRYAERIQTHIPKLAEDIRKKYGQHQSAGWPKVTPKPLRSRKEEPIPETKGAAGMGIPPEHLTDAHLERSDEPEDHQPDDMNIITEIDWVKVGGEAHVLVFVHGKPEEINAEIQEGKTLKINSSKPFKLGSKNGQIIAPDEKHNTMRRTFEVPIGRIDKIYAHLRSDCLKVIGFEAIQEEGANPT